MSTALASSILPPRPRERNWLVVIVAVLAVVGAVIGLGMYRSFVIDGGKVKLAHGQEVLYGDGGTRVEAKAVGKALVTLEYFDDKPTGPKATVQVRRHAGRAVVVFVVKDSALERTAKFLHRSMHTMAGDLSAQAFAGKPVDIWLADEYLEEHVILVWSERPQQLATTDGSVLRFHSGATEQEARAVHRVLADYDYFEVTGGDVVLAYDGRRPVVNLVLSSDYVKRTDIHFYYEIWAHRVSSAVFGGKPVDIWLVDEQEWPATKLRFEDIPHPPLEVANRSIVQYRDGATLDEARGVAEVFEQFFATSDTTAVLVTRTNDRHVVTLHVHDWAIESEEMLAWYHEHADRLSRRAFANGPVDLRIANLSYEVRVELTWETRPRNKSVRPPPPE